MGSGYITNFISHNLMQSSGMYCTKTQFYDQCKQSLKPAEVVNYSFVLQDAAQGFHWNNS